MAEIGKRGSSIHWTTAGQFEDNPDDFFDYFFGSYNRPVIPSNTGWHPAADMYETDESIVIVVDISGVSPKNVGLTLFRNTLLLQGVRVEQSGPPSRQYYKMEIPYGPFERLFHLPSPVRSDDVQAAYKDGLLTIILKKCDKPALKKAKIKIR